MSGKKLYTIVLISMSLLAALGMWAMIDSAIAYRNRPRIEAYTTQEVQTQSRGQSPIGGTPG